MQFYVATALAEEPGLSSRLLEKVPFPITNFWQILLGVIEIQ
jgi:hypothetical protein